MNKYQMMLFPLLIILILGTNPIILLSAENSTYKSQWKVINWNENRHVTWNWPDVNFTVEIGSYINYTLDEYNPDNFTHPSSGRVEIGNISEVVTNNKTAESLILSIYGWFPGLITSSADWEQQKEVAANAASGLWTKGVLDISEPIYNHSGLFREAINFTYAQDPSIGNQNTTLIYDKKTGVLLEGFTEIFFDYYYVLEISLVYSDLITATPQSSNIVVFSSIISLVCLVFYKRTSTL